MPPNEQKSTDCDHNLDISAGGRDTSKSQFVGMRAPENVRNLKISPT